MCMMLPCTELARGHAIIALKNPVEGAEALVAAMGRDVVDAFLGGDQQQRRVLHPQLQQILVEAHARHGPDDLIDPLLRKHEFLRHQAGAQLVIGKVSFGGVDFSG